MTDETPPVPADTGEPRHRASGRRGRRGVILAVVAVLVAVAVTTGFLLHGSNDPKPKAAPPPTTSSTPPPPPTPTPTPTKTIPPKPVIPHEAVAAAGPTGFRFQGPNYTIDAHVCGMPYVRPLDPPGEQHHTVCWVDEGFGVAPGSKSGTTYVLGHSWAENSLEVLNRISEPSTKQILAAHPKDVDGIATYPVTVLNGSMITLWTPKGVLRYKVRDAYGVAKNDAGYLKPLMNEQTKNRIVIITCAERGGRDYDYNVIVDAYLFSSQKLRPRTT